MDYTVVILLCGISGLIGVWAGSVLGKRSIIKKLSLNLGTEITLSKHGKKMMKEALKDIAEGRIEKVK